MNLLDWNFIEIQAPFGLLPVYRFILIGSTLSHKSKCLFSSHVESRMENVRWWSVLLANNLRRDASLTHT